MKNEVCHISDHECMVTCMDFGITYITYIVSSLQLDAVCEKVEFNPNHLDEP